jgi:hypothetical protein
MKQGFVVQIAASSEVGPRGEPTGMLSPIATVEFSKLRHLGQSDRGAASSVLSQRRQPLWNQGPVESARPWSPGMVLAVYVTDHSSDDATRHPMSSKETAVQPAHQTRFLSRPEAYGRHAFFLFVVPADSFVTKRIRLLIERFGSRRNRTEEHTTCIQPIFASRIPIVPIVSSRSKIE